MEDLSVRYSLVDLDQLLPLTNKLKMLTWLKEHYIKAQDAMAYGFEGATIIQHGELVVTAEEIVSAIDIKKGRIGQKGAQLLINIYNSGAIPPALIVSGQSVNQEFYNFAFDISS